MNESEVEALAYAEFWDERYSKAGEEPTHEWFRSFDALEPFFKKHLFTKPHDARILHLGSGDSSIPSDLQSRGYTNQLCIDFSSVVVNLMSTRSTVEWKCGDVRNMDIPSSSVDVAFDKGTLDAMIHGSPWNPPEDVKENASKYMDEVRRVLKDDGVFLYITYRQPHFVKPLLGEWKLEMEVLGGGDSFDYYGFILGKPLSVHTRRN
ncbi:S-adenosyl-L-methionine-dependent methyltransferase [Phyllosticta capitalensis]